MNAAQLKRVETIVRAVVTSSSVPASIDDVDPHTRTRIEARAAETGQHPLDVLAELCAAQRAAFEESARLDRVAKHARAATRGRA